MTAVCIEHVTTAGDRWDLLAWDYYGDAHGYARIVAANPHMAPHVGVLPVLPAGVRLAIPVIGRPASAHGLPPWKRGTR